MFVSALHCGLCLDYVIASDKSEDSILIQKCGLCKLLSTLDYTEWEQFKKISRDTYSYVEVEKCGFLLSTTISMLVVYTLLQTEWTVSFDLNFLFNNKNLKINYWHWKGVPLSLMIRYKFSVILVLKLPLFFFLKLMCSARSFKTFNKEK